MDNKLITIKAHIDDLNSLRNAMEGDRTKKLALIIYSQCLNTVKTKRANRLEA